MSAEEMILAGVLDLESIGRRIYAEASEEAFVAERATGRRVHIARVVGIEQRFVVTELLGNLPKIPRWLVWHEGKYVQDSWSG